MARILVVEDDPIIRRLLMLLLDHVGHVTLEAIDGTQALSALDNHHFDLVLLDHVMPNRDGLSVLSSLRQDTSKAKLPVVMLSAFASEKNQQHAKTLGANDYVVKPFGVTDLTDRIQALL